MYTSTQL